MWGPNDSLKMRVSVSSEAIVGEIGAVDLRKSLVSSQDLLVANVVERDLRREAHRIASIEETLYQRALGGNGAVALGGTPGTGPPR